MDIERFKERPLFGILRSIELDVVEPLVETIISSGLRTVEVTMNSANAEKIITRMVQSAKGRLTVGAGTVLTDSDLKRALEAGATFIVSPTLVRSVAGYCVDNGVPFFPGALTPQEIFDAWRSGATMVKVFPIKFFGPAYIKEIKGPFRDIELLACGGITPDNIKEYFANGAGAVAFGESVFRKDWLASRDFTRIGRAITELVSKI
ncbi:MAG: bifunctional 4-hydroxy-2-oxoglutarate aldolase/2-dehydro-3-deoxy-phosphogluconate aldolase [Candidatus Omnitrophota bacterium]